MIYNSYYSLEEKQRTEISKANVNPKRETSIDR